MNQFIFFTAMLCVILLITIFSTHSDDPIDELNPTTTNDNQSPMNVFESDDSNGEEISSPTESRKNLRQSSN